MPTLKSHGGDHGPRTALPGYLGAAALVAVHASSLFSWGIYVQLAGVVSAMRLLPVYAPLLILQHAIERKWRRDRPVDLPRPLVQEITALGWVAFPALGWLASAWFSGASVTDVAVVGPALFVGYAHGVHFVLRTGRGARWLGGASIAFGGLLIVITPLSLASTLLGGVVEGLETLTFPGARLAIASYGAALLWTGLRLGRGGSGKRLEAD